MTRTLFVLICLSITFVVLFEPVLAARNKCPNNKMHYNKKTKVCECKQGFKAFSKDRPNKCIPACTNCPSSVGHCTANNICTCRQGFVKNSTGYCVPSECPGPDHDCQPNGKCIDGKCKCDPGYNWHAPSEKCLPLCEYCDLNDHCSSEECTCWDSYEIRDEIDTGNRSVRRCQPKCTPKCMGGVCIEAGVCNCNAGYRLLNGSLHECQPICDTPCTNGKCVAPNQCECLPGFRRPVGEDPNHCWPICMDGFVLDAQSGTCKCMEQYEMSEDGQRCRPICDHGCDSIHGVCVSPGRCACNMGYELDQRDRRSCLAVCDGGCKGGVCISPGVCKCPEHMRFQRGACVLDCVNADADEANERCLCWVGFQRSADDELLCDERALILVTSTSSENMASTTEMATSTMSSLEIDSVENASTTLKTLVKATSSENTASTTEMATSTMSSLEIEHSVENAPTTLKTLVKATSSKTTASTTEMVTSTMSSLRIEHSVENALTTLKTLVKATSSKTTKNTEIATKPTNTFEPTSNATSKTIYNLMIQSLHRYIAKKWKKHKHFTRPIEFVVWRTNFMRALAKRTHNSRGKCGN